MTPQRGGAPAAGTQQYRVVWFHSRSGSEVKTMAWSGIVIRCVAAFVAAGVVGCVSLPDYERAKRRAETAEQINESLERRANQLEQEYDELKAQLRTYGDLKAELADKEQQIAKLGAMLREALERDTASVYQWQGNTGEFTVNPVTQGIVLPGSVYFASGQAVIRERMKPNVQRLADLIRERDPNEEYLIFVDGYTDRQPVKISIEENIDNWFLGCRRANSVFEYLTDTKKLAEDKFVLHSYGYLDEIVKGVRDAKDNRRVELGVSDGI